MSDLTIKVNVGNRTYPVTTTSRDQETIHQAARMVNDTIQSLKENYAVKDMQDLLAMTALQIASRLSSNQSDSQSAQSQLSEIGQLLDDALNRY